MEVDEEERELEEMCIARGGASRADFHSQLRSAAVAAVIMLRARSNVAGGVGQAISQCAEQDDNDPCAEHGAHSRAHLSHSDGRAGDTGSPDDGACPGHPGTEADGVGGEGREMDEKESMLARLKPNAIVPKPAHVAPTWSVHAPSNVAYSPENRWNVQKQPFTRRMFQVGQHVLAKFNGSEEHYDGMVAKINEDGKTYRIVFADGESWGLGF
jgi:hypothetical protein